MVKIDRLSPELMREFESFLVNLINNKDSAGKGRLSQHWASGLKDINADSLELQKKALVWRQK